MITKFKLYEGRLANLPEINHLSNISTLDLKNELLELTTDHLYFDDFTNNLNIVYHFQLKIYDTINLEEVLTDINSDIEFDYGANYYGDEQDIWIDTGDGMNSFAYITDQDEDYNLYDIYTKDKKLIHILKNIETYLNTKKYNL